jgi:mannose/cellobiose epimerase-like protein (N-acyl-D-glucosamine 2-epimerase family)
MLACNRKPVLFEQISSSRSGIDFNNVIVEDDTLNPMNVVNIYNGGGVGIGDFNNDGLPDIYFTGNRVPCRLYLNKGDFKFEDITAKAGVEDMGRWARGVSVIDINNDGLMDIYICNTIYKDSLRRRNVLYVNQGPDKDGIPHFTDMAAEYGLDIHVQSTMASFFDYDNDGDLDMYLTVNEASSGSDPSAFHPDRKEKFPGLGRLYRNDMDAVVKHPVFHDVSQQAGMQYEGYGHAATICDINNDGWKDIYVSDDFISNNILYINNHDGTFTNQVKDYFKHTSLNSMGQDVVDMNNDGLPDVVELDMNPEDNYRKKLMMGPSSYLIYQNFNSFGYQYQYVRNTLQLNQGPSVGQEDSTGIPAFADIGFLSGMSQTDWSWTPLISDFDNDSYRDLIVTNGFPKDVSDHDFAAYRKQSVSVQPIKELLKQIPQIKLHNYAFHNNGDLTFADRTADWGLSKASFSNGAAYADLDNDGAVDIVINNINDEAFVYRNTARDGDKTATHFLQIKFIGNPQNINGLGATAAIFYNRGTQQVYDNNPYRGYLSTMQPMAHFGLGKTSLLDSVVIKWNNGMRQILRNIKADQVLTVKMEDAREPYIAEQPTVAVNALFKEVTSGTGIHYKHREGDQIDFNFQHLLPHKLSEYCPALAAGDIDGDGWDDLVIGGNSNAPAQVFLQQANGSFRQRALLPGAPYPVNYEKDQGILLFDANGDGKPDLYVARGGYLNEPGSASYQDKLYINDGKGNFKEDPSALPENHISKLCVRAMDINQDGKPDLFVSGRVDPQHYPRPVSSFIFRNDSENGHAKFTDVTAEVAPDLKDIGMVCDALFTDFDGDGQTDLIVVGEWMPVTFLKNVNGIFRNVTPASGIGNESGWWNSIVAGDFRHTGRTDYIVGNIGENTLYKASEAYPVYITAKDLDHNGSYIAIPSLFFPDKQGVKKEFPAPGRDDVARQWPGIKKRFPDYKSFATATMDEVLTPDQRKGALRLKASRLQSCYLRNEGGGKFTMIPLPKEAQVSALNGMVVDDLDGDGNLDLLINGNDFGTDVSIGRYDALNGLLLKGDGAGGFTPLSILRSGIYIPGDGKALVKLSGPGGAYMVAASQNKGVLKLYQRKTKTHAIPVGPEDLSALIRLKNGKTRKEEFYFGSSFLSQSARFLDADSNVVSVTITDSRGRSRVCFGQSNFMPDSILPQMRYAAKEGLLDKYYPRNIDTLYGGYLSTFSYDLKPVGPQDKMIVTQARHVWSTAKAALFYQDTSYIAYARHGFYFLRDKMWDAEHGGFYNLVTREGVAKSPFKEAYGNAFAIFALSAYYECAGDTAALGLAKAAFRWLERYSHDPQYKGYFQHLERDGRPVKRTAAVDSRAETGYKDQNSSIHLLEAFTELYHVWPDPLVRARLLEMLQLIRDRMVTRKGYLQLFFTTDWKAVSYRDSSEEAIIRHKNLDHVSFGHDVETAYLMQEASEALGFKDDKVTRAIGKKMVDHALANGWDNTLGGFYDEGYYFRDKPGCTVINRSKNWWAQAEGLNTLLIFSELYPTDTMHYRQRFIKLWQYVQTYMIDHEHGDWYEEGLDNEPQRRTALKAHIWKATYHNFRALSNCIRRMSTRVPTR